MPNENTGVENFDSLINEMESIINEKPPESPESKQPEPSSTVNEGEQKQDNPAETTQTNQQESGSAGIPELEIEADDEREYYERRQKYNQMKPEDQKKSFFEMADSIVEESEEKNLMKDEEDLSRTEI